MRFIEADWLYLLIVPILLMPVIAVISRNRRKKQLEALLGANADSPDAVHLSRTARVWRHLLLIGAASALIVAAARPSAAAKLLPFEPKGRDIMVLCDVSRSMNAADIAPSRLKHAQYILRQLSSREQGDRFGLVPFAGSAFLSCPLTSDPVTFNEYVDELSTDSVPVGGTNLEKALQVAEKAFAASESGNRAIVLLTDGEELQGNSSSFVRKLKEKHIPLFIIGLGDPVNGAVIPRGEEGAGFVRDAAGKVVTSRLNEKQLAALAAETGGIYCRSTVTDTGVEKLANAIAGLDRAARENVKRRIPVEEFPKALGAGLLLLVLFMLISEKKMPASSLLLLFGAFLLTGAGEKDADAVKPAAKPELVIPADPVGMYNLARELQLSGDPGYAGIYGKLLARRDTGRELAARAYNNLGAGIHQQCQKEIAAAQGQVGKQQLDQALKALEQAAGLAGSAGELYSRAAPGADAIPEFGANLTRLARDRKQIEELKKKIEELKKQQKKAQDKTRQARDQNKQQQQQQQQKQQQ
ncbi:MAG: VWA domain-containing protein, partial [Lentisphaeria bacterium]|nr:VWA domain-containing protein [Lentisphaeria bacterium]